MTTSPSSRSYSYPLEPSWHSPSLSMDSQRKGSVDSNITATSTSGIEPSNSKEDKHIKPSSPDDLKQVKTGKNLGTIVRHRLENWKPEIILLDLSHCNLESIPKTLFKSSSYRNLSQLNLSSNKITSIPPQINQLKLLVMLDLTFNRISDLPNEVGDLNLLEALHLSGNPLNKDLMQKHLLGTFAVLQHLRDRQVELGKVRRSRGRGLKAASDPESKPRDEKITLIVVPPPTSSVNISPSSTPRAQLSASSDNVTKDLSPIGRQRSGQASLPLSPQHYTSLNRVTPPPVHRRYTPPPPQHRYTPPPPAQQRFTPPPQSLRPTPPIPPPAAQPPPSQPEMRASDMGPVISQLKFGILYTETVKSIALTDLQKQNEHIHNYNGTGTTIMSSTHGTKEKFVLRDGESRFTFNSYGTDGFSELRNLSCIPQHRYLAALESISTLGFAGKSGSVLLKSADGLLVLKTISIDEAKFLRKLLPQILAYIKLNPKTYLTRFWGLYKVIHSPIEKVNFVVMKNAFFTEKKIHERYDLKGSTVGRTTDDQNVRRSRVVLKDLNFTRQLKLGEQRSKALLEQLEKDAEFLQKFEIIDYSLIVGVHYLSVIPTKDPSIQYPIEGEIQAMNKDGQLIDEIYFLNIIDMLQPFNIRKQMEYGFKTIRYGSGISVVPPENYASRFLAFIQSIVE